jgi:NitT/TauT family transport system permease protein
VTALSSESFGAALGRRALTKVLPFVAVAAAWQLGSLFFPPFLFPSLVDVFRRHRRSRL